MATRLMLVDDHRMFREALRNSLDAEPDLEVVAEAATGAETLDAVDKSQPEVLLLDIALPDMSGIEIARRISAQYPTIRILALSGYADRLYVNEALKAGVRAYVVKSAGTDELLSGIRAVVAGHVFLSPEITGGQVQHIGTANDSPPVTVLGKREQEVLRLLSRGMSSPDIAGVLSISPATVNVHRRNIKQKLGINSIAELTRYAIREGLLVV